MEKGRMASSRSVREKCDGGFGAKRADLLTPERAERAPVDGAYGVHAAKVLVRAQGGSPGLEQRGGTGAMLAADPKTSDSRNSAARFRPSTSDSSAFLDARDLPRCVRARGRVYVRRVFHVRGGDPCLIQSPAAPARRPFAVRPQKFARPKKCRSGRAFGCQPAQYAPRVLTSANGASCDPRPSRRSRSRDALTRALARRRTGAMTLRFRRRRASPTAKPSEGAGDRLEEASRSPRRPSRSPTSPPCSTTRSARLRRGRAPATGWFSALSFIAYVLVLREVEADQAEGGAQGEGSKMAKAAQEAAQRKVESMGPEVWGKLIVCLVIDALGDSSFLLPGLGEGTDGGVRAPGGFPAVAAFPQQRGVGRGFRRRGAAVHRRDTDGDAGVDDGDVLQ